MDWLTFADWAQWGQKGAIAECAPEVRGRFEHFVSLHVAEGIAILPERERNLLKEYAEGGPAARVRCVAAFDVFMLRGRKKAALLRAAPSDPASTEEHYASVWSVYAVKCIRTMVRDLLFRNVTWGPIKVVGPDGDETNDRKGGIISRAPDPAIGILDEITLNEVKNATREFELNQREQLILWADQNDEPRCSTRMQDLAGCGRSQLSECALALESRIRGEIIRLCGLEPHEKEKTEALTFWAWQNLALRFCNLYPEKGTDSAFISKTTKMPVPENQE